MRTSEHAWKIERSGKMRVPAIIFASDALLGAMDDKVKEQLTNVAMLPGILRAAYAMPDAHWGYGFPIGGVAAFDPENGGVISAGGVGFDVSCGVRMLLTGARAEEVARHKEALADALFAKIPAGVGSTSHIRLNEDEMDAMLEQGAVWAVSRGYGDAGDLERIEEHGRVRDAKPAFVSTAARHRQAKEMGTLGSGNHYLEVQEVRAIEDEAIARTFGLEVGECVISIHCGSRGLGHQVGTDYLREMAIAAPDLGIKDPDRELACAPLRSTVGERYLGAMRAASNCALANRQILTHFVRSAFARYFPGSDLRLLYDVSHNTCKEEEHAIEGRQTRVFVHRKGATRAFGPGHPDLPESLREVGQPVLIGGSMGTASWVLAGTKKAAELAFASACHGAGRTKSRHASAREHRAHELIHTLAERGILIRSGSYRGVSEEAPDAYKDVDAVVDAADRAGLARKVARLAPMICIKG
jgi:tRNA-splicing ligase RtcB